MDKYYLEQTEKNIAVVEPVETTASSMHTGVVSTSSTTPVSWEEQKKLESERRKKEKALSNLEQQLATLEAQKKQLEQKLADPTVYSNGEKAKAVQHEIEEISLQIEQVTEQWMELSE